MGDATCQACYQNLILQDQDMMFQAAKTKIVCVCVSLEIRVCYAICLQCFDAVGWLGIRKSIRPVKN